MKSAIRTLSELAEGWILAPERYLASAGGDGVPLADLVTLRQEVAADGLVLDTTHARDGILDIASALRSPATAKSAKRAVEAGDIIVSRLRPYLRQIAYVHPSALKAAGRELAVSSEFYVLSPNDKASIAFLTPYLLSEPVQAILAAAQEGGHHPRVPRPSLLAIRIPTSLIANRVKRSTQTISALTSVYESLSGWHNQLAIRK